MNLVKIYIIYSYVVNVQKRRFIIVKKGCIAKPKHYLKMIYEMNANIFIIRISIVIVNK